MENWNHRYDQVCKAAWKIWTDNGHDLDPYWQKQTLQSVRDVVTNTFVEGLSDEEWLAAAITSFQRRNEHGTLNIS
jgi:hypothetical protein